MDRDSSPVTSSRRSSSRSRRGAGPHEDDDEEEFSHQYQDEHGLHDTPTTRSSPPRSVSFSKRSKGDTESPGIKTVGTEDTLTINHVNSTRGGGAGALALGKPLMCLVIVLVLLSMGAGLWGFLTIPGLYKQIEELEYQVDRLTTEIDRLENQVDRFEVLNANLNASIIELESINQDLNATANRLEDSVDELEIINDQLSLENDRYSQLNDEMNEAAAELGAQVDELEANVDDLEEANADLRILTSNLQNETNRLGVQVENLNTTAANLARENDRLRELNANLETIVGFLNETSGEISETLEGVTEFLAEQIVGNRRILLESLENTFTQGMVNWDCAFRQIFRDRSFIIDENSPMGIDVGAALAHVEERFLNEFCANRVDFENYLEGTYGQLTSLTANQLYQGVAIYAKSVLNYYFPDPGRPGLTQEDWAEADYDCENVADFVFDSTP